MKPRHQRPQAVHLTDIVAGVYCEKRMMLDADRGSAKPEHVRARAEAGIRAHKRFENEATYSSGTDSRCFIASAIYGHRAWQTNNLRRFRDDRLMSTRTGRGFVALYYRLSPAVARHLHSAGRHSLAWRATRFVLDAFVKRLQSARRLESLKTREDCPP